MESEQIVSQEHTGNSSERQNPYESLLADARAKFKELEARFGLFSEMSNEVFGPKETNPDGSPVEYDKAAWSAEFDRVSKEMSEMRSYVEELSKRVYEKKDHSVAA